MRPRPLRSLRAATACVTLLAAGCSADGAPGAGASLSSTLIQDQLHGGQTDFFFLPPVVPPPAAFGDFLPELQPEVVAEQIDPLDETTVLDTLATYTRGRRGAERVRVHLQNDLPDDGDADPAGYFVVRFRSGDFALAGGDLVRFRVILDGRQLGMADVKVLDRVRDKKLIDRSQYGFVVAGKVLRVKFRIDRGAIAVDSDSDGVDDAHDNCPSTWNADQLDSLGNGVGDACRCDAVVCEPSGPGCVAGSCAPESGTCAPERCIADWPATFSGTVSGRDFGLLPGATVSLADGQGHSVTTSTDARGRFTLSVPFASADLRVAAPGFDAITAHLSFQADTMAEGYDYVLLPNLAWYSVLVWSAPGVPAPDALVTVEYQDGRAAAGTTGNDGKVLLELQPVGVSLRLKVDRLGQSLDIPMPGLLPGINVVVVGLY